MGTRIRNNPDHVFDLFCEIAIPSNCNETAQIAWKFPPNFKDEETLKSVPLFAYPLEFTDNAVHHFSFVLTNVDSKWTFGFCRHAPSYPSCFVILSSLPWHETFYRILNHAAELSSKEKLVNSEGLLLFLEALYKTPVPDPGLELRVNHEEEFVVSCPDHNKLPSIPGNRNMTEYFNAVDATNMMTIFASMLHERRILVLSKKLSRLSACVQAANSLIYPMHWQHIFIPVLPKHLLDYLTAPMPFLIGVPASTFARMKQSEIGDVVLLDADNNKVESPYPDLDALPSEVLQSLRHDLKHPQEMLGDGVARAFLRASVKLIGGYWNALKLKPGEKISFNAEMFIQTRPPPMQPFLEKMLQLQIFQQFIESRLKMLNSGQGVSDEFEFELTAHEDKASTRLRNQYRDWVSYMKKEGGAFFKNVRKQVKVTGKKAYKDLRSRIHEMHHHKIIENTPVREMHKRGNSVPSFLEEVDFAEKSSSNQKGMSSVSEKANSEKTPEKPEGSTGSNSSLFDSPSLTFKPIDMDLMGDLHELIFRRCSLCGDSSQTRTSISDPQLIDLNSDERQCSDCISKHQTNSAATSEDTPPPLLPRPPTIKSPLKNTSMASKSLLRCSDQPLIQLDTDDNCNITSRTNAFSLSYKENGNLDISPQTNPFKSSLFCSSQDQIKLSPSEVKSTNPFHKETFPVPSPYSLTKCSSGPSVKTMVSQWQSSLSATNCYPTGPGKVKTTSPDVIPYRSQPLSRTVSTPPPSFASISPPQLHTHPAPGRPGSQNPFLSASAEMAKVPQPSPKLHSASTNASWEHFQ